MKTPVLCLLATLFSLSAFADVEPCQKHVSSLFSAGGESLGDDWASPLRIEDARQIFRDGLDKQIEDSGRREQVRQALERPTTRAYSAYGISLIVAELTPGGENACRVLWMANFVE